MKQIIVALLFVSLTLFGRIAGAEDVSPEKYMELFRSDLRTQKVAFVTKAMDLNAKEGEKFWPIYREYDHTLAIIVDARLANIKAYAANYNSMTKAKADELVKAALKINRDRFDLQETYYNKIAKANSTVIAARFLQVEWLVNNLVDLQITRQLPLAPKLVAEPPKQ